MPVLAANGCCLDSQQEEDTYILKNSCYPGYACQGNLQGLRSCWAARNCLISEFLLYLTDYQGERALSECLKPLIQQTLHYLTIHKCCSYQREWSYTNTVTYRCIYYVMFCKGAIILRILVLWICVAIVMTCEVYRWFLSCFVLKYCLELSTAVLDGNIHTCGWNLKAGFRDFIDTFKESRSELRIRFSS